MLVLAYLHLRRQFRFEMRVISKSSVARNIGVLYDSCQWNIMSQPYARQASTTFETVAAEGNTLVALRRKYSCMLSFLRDWTSVIYYRNKLSRDFSMFKPLSLNTDIVSKRGYCNCISRSTIGSIFLSDLI